MDILEDSGSRVLATDNADEAIAELESHDEVALLSSDIDMPGSMNKLELAQVVYDRGPNIRLLLTSGYRQPTQGQIPDGGWPICAQTICNQ